MNNLVGNIFKKLDDLAVRIVSTAIVLFGSINIASAETIFGGAKIYKFFTSYDDIIAAVIVIGIIVRIFTIGGDTLFGVDVSDTGKKIRAAVFAVIGVLLVWLLMWELINALMGPSGYTIPTK